MKEWGFRPAEAGPFAGVGRGVCPLGPQFRAKGTDPLALLDFEPRDLSLWPNLIQNKRITSRGFLEMVETS